MTRPYASAHEHLDDAIALVAMLVERQIVMHWEQGLLPRIKDQYSGTFVSGGEVLALLRNGMALAPEAQRQLADLDAAIGAREERIDARLDESRRLGDEMPFDQLRRAFGLSPTEQRALWVLTAIECSERLRALMRYLVNESTRIYADVGLLKLLVYGAPSTRGLLIHELAPTGSLLSHRLIEPVGGARTQSDSPFLLRPFKVASRVIDLVHGVVRLDREVADVATLEEALPPLAMLIMPEELKAEVTSMVRHASSGQVAPAIVLSGPEGSGRKSLVFGAARALDRRVLHVRCDRLPFDPADLARVAKALVREAVLFRAVPLFENIETLVGNPEAGRPERAGLLDRELDGFVGPVTATCEQRDSRPVAFARGLVMVDVPVPSEAARAELWSRTLGPGEVDFERVASRYPITGGLIARAADSAGARARARGAGEPITEDDVHVGIRSTLDAKLSTLGTRIARRQSWSDLVLPEDSLNEIREFIARVRYRRRVYDDWGFRKKLAKGLGLSALFAGPPGTGKTMVAGIIADELSLDLYQIDLSRVVSKYVGETEKNLAGVFDAAEAGHAILLFDEADSLFAKRTEVKSSVDRYANLEVNYLLQRMEQFNGMTILTTNLDSSIDDAFRRRMSFRVDFPMPEIEERTRLWRSMIPTQAKLAHGIDFRSLAAGFELSGGYIRNAVLRAAFLAAADDTPITQKHLQRAANLEYASMGKLSGAFQ